MTAAALSPALTLAGPLPAKSSNAGAVRVSVTPVQTGPGADWTFEITMNTHVKDLDADLTTSAVLIDSAGRPHKPKSWQGDPPGGHHRKGILSFPALNDESKSFELQLTGIGDKRVFKWTMQ